MLFVMFRIDKCWLTNLFKNNTKLDFNRHCITDLSNKCTVPHKCTDVHRYVALLCDNPVDVYAWNYDHRWYIYAVYRSDALPVYVTSSWIVVRNWHRKFHTRTVAKVGNWTNWTKKKLMPTLPLQCVSAHDPWFQLVERMPCYISDKWTAVNGNIR